MCRVLLKQCVFRQDLKREGINLSKTGAEWLQALAATPAGGGVWVGGCSEVSGRGRPESAGGCVNVQQDMEIMKMDPADVAVDAAV